MRLTESQLRIKIRSILSELQGRKHKEGSLTQRALGHTGGGGGIGGSGGDGVYDYDEDDMAYDIDIALSDDEYDDYE